MEKFIDVLDFGQRIYSVTLAGELLGVLDEDARALLRGRLLGFVFQSFQLLPSLNAIENVMLPLELAGVAKAQAEAEFREEVGPDVATVVALGLEAYAS